MIESYRLAALKSGYPMHLGVTEAGTERKMCIRDRFIAALFLYGIYLNERKLYGYN